MALKELLIRRQPTIPWHKVALAGLGGAITISLLALSTEIWHTPLLAATFGASCVLVFTMPEAPLSQPINVIGGHMVSTACGLLTMWALPEQWWSTGIAVGLAIAAMAALRVTHPPAGANPIVIITSTASWSYAVTPIALGSIIVVLAGIAFHRLTDTNYPTGLFAAEKTLKR